MLSTQQEANLDVREPRHPAPDDGVARRGVTGAIQVATEARKLYQTGFQRWSGGVYLTVTCGEPIQKIDLQRRERERRSSIAGRAVEHCQPEAAPAQDAECREQVDETLSSVQLRLFGVAARFKDLMEGLSGKGLARCRAVRFQPLPIRTAREVFPQAAHPASFVERVMDPVVRRPLSLHLSQRRAAAGFSSPNTAPRRRRGIRYSIAAIPHLTFAAVSAASTESGLSSRRSRGPR